MTKKQNWYSMIEKSGKGIVADHLESVKKEMLKLPSPSFNWAIGGGMAFGKIFTVYGPEQAGKSLIAQLAIAELHKNDPEAFALWYDAEFSFDKDYARKLGIDLNRLWIIQTNKPSEIFDHFYDDVWPMMQEGFPLKIMVIDSVKSIRGPRESDTKSVEDHVIGDISSLLNKAFRKIIEPIRKHKILTICVQQVNEEMDQTKQMLGHKWRVPSGQALKHFSDYMVLVEKAEGKKNTLFDDTYKNIRKLPIKMGHRIRCKVEKNRTDNPGGMAEFWLKYGVGIVNVPQEVAELAVELKLVGRPSAVAYEFNGEKFIGINKFVEAVEAKPELRRALIEAIYAFDPAQLHNNKEEAPSEGTD